VDNKWIHFTLPLQLHDNGATLLFGSDETPRFKGNLPKHRKFPSLDGATFTGWHAFEEPAYILMLTLIGGVPHRDLGIVPCKLGLGRLIDETQNSRPKFRSENDSNLLVLENKSFHFSDSSGND
jgi:hypothetical protein